MRQSFFTRKRRPTGAHLVCMIEQVLPLGPAHGLASIVGLRKYSSEYQREKQCMARTERRSRVAAENTPSKFGDQSSLPLTVGEL